MIRLEELDLVAGFEHRFLDNCVICTVMDKINEFKCCGYCVRMMSTMDFRHSSTIEKITEKHSVGGIYSKRWSKMPVSFKVLKEKSEEDLTVERRGMLVDKLVSKFLQGNPQAYTAQEIGDHNSVGKKKGAVKKSLKRLVELNEVGVKGSYYWWAEHLKSK